MKFSVVLGCLATSALAIQHQSVAQRDLKTITDVLDEVKSDLQKVDDEVKNYSTDKAPLLKASNDLIQTLKDSKTKVDGSESLSLNDAVSLTTPVNELTEIGKTLASDLKERRGKVEELGECSLVRTQIGSINDASQALIKSVVSKVPEEAQSIAQQLADGLTDLLKQSQDDFSEANCKDQGKPPGGGETSAPGGGESTSAPAGSTSAPPAPGTTSAPGGGASPTGGNGGSPSPTGDKPPVVTGGAAAMAPLGGLAVAIVALLA